MARPPPPFSPVGFSGETRRVDQVSNSGRLARPVASTEVVAGSGASAFGLDGQRRKSGSGNNRSEGLSTVGLFRHLHSGIAQDIA